MAARDRIGAGLARAALAVAKRLGVTVQLNHRGVGNVALYASVLKDEIVTGDEGSVLYEARVITLEIPVQTGFAYSSTQGEPVTPGDFLTINARVHEVLQPVSKDATGRLYTIRAAQQKRLNQG